MMAVYSHEGEFFLYSEMGILQGIELASDLLAPKGA
jgi:hypothetical protein